MGNNTICVLKGKERRRVLEFRKITKLTDQEIRLRVPRNLVKVIKVHAQKNGRSRNAEILHRLVDTLEGAKEE